MALRRQLSLAVFILASLYAILDTPTATAADLTGNWSGEWSSNSTRHHGPMRCTFTKLDETSYRADFSGRFFKILPFRYSVVLSVIADNGDSVQLSGSHELGRRLGTFTYVANATCTDFVADYSSCKDCGQFNLSRCCQ